MQMLAMHDVTIDAIQPGSETSAVTITVESGGTSVPITMADRHASDYDIAFAGLWSVADLIYVVSRLDDAEITAVDTESVVSDATDVLRVGKIQQRRGGTGCRSAAGGRRSPPPVVS